ncbi:unnamed protein product [Parascedosporium putredinis]|uniref:Major facilitator superfamily (MFS) profile domain-containing protein n=1 Tax=Parascedosporium putredinis TaxID=1442378 RepID=A0A9P1HBP1_9PEZI|nr:unnamed protein product [Parascedosporium putredinis]CAI8003450.1 unnamed protein product [Parascedosporium putredinis]
MSAGEYMRTRLSTLRPPMNRVKNPIPLLRMLNGRQWAFFGVALAAWTWDALDFFTVSLTVSDLAKDFNRTKTDITWAITLVLMFRSVGAVIFGILSDRYGRKWPFIFNNFLFVVIELGTGFCTNFTQFLVCRAIFGVAMGGLYGNAAATALEDCPEEARGLISGMLQQGNDAYIHQKRLLADARAAAASSSGDRAPSASRTFARQGKVALSRHWRVLVYLVLLMAGFNFMSHGSQDIYPVMLSNQFGFTPDMITVTQVVANLGAIIGGTTVGYLSQFFGRRLTIMACCVVGGALLYPYTFVSNYGVAAAAFFQQFCVQGAWGVIPIHLMELSPAPCAPSSTIEASLGERFPLPPTEEGEPRYEYGRVICIFMGCVYGYLLILTFLGPENMGRSFDAEDDEDAVAVAGKEVVEAARVAREDEEKTRKGLA